VTPEIFNLLKITDMPDSLRISPPSAPRHYIIVVHGMGEQKLNTTIPPFVHRFAEVRQKKSEKFYEIILPATQSSHSVRSETEQHGWAEYRGISVEDKECVEDFDGSPATKTSGENFRFVELYWQDILQRHQELFASETEVWAKALLNRLRDKTITPQEWLPSWAIPMLQSIVNTAVPLKKLLVLKFAPLTKMIFDGYLGDVHLYGDYARTRGEAVRHFHLELDKIIFNDFLDWRIRELSASRLNGGELTPGHYQKPDLTVVAHSLGGIMSFDALVYAFVKEEIRMASAENIRFSSSLPFLGYTTPLNEEESIDKKQQKIDAFIRNVKDFFIRKVIDEVRIHEYKGVVNKLYNVLTGSHTLEKDRDEWLEALNCELGGFLPISLWLTQFAGTEEENEFSEEKNFYKVTEDVNYFEEKESPKESESNEKKIRSTVKTIVDNDLRKIDDFIKEKVKQTIEGESRLPQEIAALVKKVDEIINGQLEEVAEEVRNRSQLYWKYFLDGFSDPEDSASPLKSQKSFEKPLDYQGLTLNGIPLLLWRKQVKTFITLGAPIDKFVAMWHQNYQHLGLYIKGYTIPSKWLLPCECQYEFPESLSSRTIRHYNFCDEQDPVGHHLDLTRRTSMYRKIFSTADTARRDVVYRRYAVPGVAHIMYWQDGELFRGILREILDRKPLEGGELGTSTYFVRSEFVNGKKAGIQGMIWAYFRIPFLASLLTGVIILLGMRAFYLEETTNMFLLFLFAFSSWIMPGVLTYYKEKTQFKGVQQSSFILFFKKILAPGIFLRLILAAVEWRRILVTQSEGEAGDTDEKSRLSFQKNGEGWALRAWWPFAWRWSWRMLITALLLFCFTAAQWSWVKDSVHPFFKTVIQWLPSVDQEAEQQVLYVVVSYMDRIKQHDKPAVEQSVLNVPTGEPKAESMTVSKAELKSESNKAVNISALLWGIISGLSCYLFSLFIVAVQYVRLKIKYAEKNRIQE
jgi:hypothetical protein